MSEKSNPRRGEPLASQSSGSQSSESQSSGSDSTPVEEQQVGPGRPPPDKRWKKGGPSPNPRGRPRKEASTLSDIRKIFEQVANKKVWVSRGDRKAHMTRLQLGLEQLFNQFANGDRHARLHLMKYAEKFGVDFLAKHRQEIEEALTQDHQAILDRFLARRSSAGNVAPATPVLAPPDLVDDDIAQPEPELPSPPKAEIEPAPPQIPGQKPFNRMSRTEKWAWYPEWCEKHPERCAKRGP
jgi:hypothetical protein